MVWKTATGQIELCGQQQTAGFMAGALHACFGGCLKLQKNKPA